MCIDWLQPWSSVDGSERQSLENELRKELADGHALFGKRIQIIGRRCDQDDVLCLIEGSKSVAVVHLTWRCAPEPDPKWPFVRLFDDIEAWIETGMKSEHEQFS
jgi:hypothetical protein